MCYIVKIYLNGGLRVGLFVGGAFLLSQLVKKNVISVGSGVVAGKCYQYSVVVT